MFRQLAVVALFLTGFALTSAPASAYTDSFEGSSLDPSWQVDAFDGTGSASVSNGSLTVSNAGSGDFWLYADTGTAVMRQAAPDATLFEVDLTAFAAPGYQRFFALRSSMGADAAFVAILLDDDLSHFTVVWRDSPGADGDWAGNDTGLARTSGLPVRLRLTLAPDRQTVTASVLLQGAANWVIVGQHTVMAPLGVAALLGGGGYSATATFDEYSEQPDADGDEIADGTDNCPYLANTSQTDSDNDGRGDACEGKPIYYDFFGSANPGSTPVVPSDTDSAGSRITTTLGLRNESGHSTTPDSGPGYDATNISFGSTLPTGAFFVGQPTFESQGGGGAQGGNTMGTCTFTDTSFKCTNGYLGAFGNNLIVTATIRLTTAYTGQSFKQPFDTVTYDPVVRTAGARALGSQTFDITKMPAVAVQQDADGDGVLNANDNCPSDANAGQANNDADAQGDACDADDDNDGVDDGADRFPFDPKESVDTDNDGVGDNGDNCRTVSNAGQANHDGDSQGDACDPDDDNDGLPDTEDSDPFDNQNAKPSNKDQCKNDGWRRYRVGGKPFKNQGDCVSYVATRGKNQPAG